MADKVCSTCRVRKPTSDFYLDGSKKDGLSSGCRDCVRARSRKRALANPELNRSRANQWCKDNRAKAHANYLRWKERNPGRETERHREWRSRNRAKWAEYGRRREARKIGVGASAVDYDLILERDGLFCYLCSTAVASRPDVHFDHVIPLARGGSHSPDNIRVTHADCNRRKHTKLPEEMGILV